VIPGSGAGERSLVQPEVSALVFIDSFCGRPGTWPEADADFPSLSASDGGLGEHLGPSRSLTLMTRERFHVSPPLLSEAG